MALLCCPLAAMPQAQQAPKAQENLSSPLPIDTAVRAGTLPNGLKYFIRKNGRPAQRASMRLAVQAGSIDEQESERGLAHFLEHMGFNGSTHFKPGELVKYLESIGANFGADVNAYTSYDETVYMLEVPTDKPGLLDRGFVALADFAGGMTLGQDEVERERGVIIEEWRSRRGAQARIQEQQAPAMYGASKYATREPIGRTEVLKGATAAQLRAFYTKWYRPDRMAIVVVGDFDPAVVEARIRAEFGALKKPATPPPPRVYPIPPHAEPRYAVIADPETQQSSVTVMEKRPVERQDRVGDYRRSLVENLAFSMLNARFAELARRPDAPFLSAQAGQSGLSRTTQASVLTARVKDGTLEAGLRAVAQEAARASRHGFTEGELERARKRVLSSYERMFKERTTAESAGLASELVRHFLEAEAVPGMEKEFELAQRFVPAITAAEATDVIRTLLKGTNRVVLAVSPQKAGVRVPAQAVLASALSTASTGDLAAWLDGSATQELLAKRPEPGTVKSSRTLDAIGVTVLTLSNGVEVYLKPTDFKNDQIVFTSYAKGGLSLASQADYQDADLAVNLVDLGGVGGFTPVDLEKMLAGKSAGAGAYIGPYTHGINGSASTKDLETALQLAYLQVTAPNFAPEALTLLRTRLESALANRAQSPGAAFGETLEAVNTLDHYSSKPLRVEDLGTLRPAVMKAFYTERFANAADLTFFFVGSFSVEAITPLLTRYLGALPSKGTATSKAVDMQVLFPAQVRKQVVRKGKEPKASTAISFFADTGLDEMEMHRLRAAASVLEMRLTDIIREEMGGTYGVGVGYADMQPVPGYGLVQVSFGSAPDTVDTLVAAVMKEVARLRAEGPTDEDLQKVKEIEKRGLETNARNNGYWVSSMQTVHSLGWDVTGIARRPQRTESLSKENVKAAFVKYFPDARYTQVTLLPEN